MLSLFALDSDEREAALRELRMRAQSAPCRSEHTFWIAVAGDDPGSASALVEGMIACGDEAKLRWLHSDHHRILRRFVPAWVQALADRAGVAAALIAATASASLQLPATHRKTEMAQQQETQPQGAPVRATTAKRVRRVYPLGLVCQLRRIRGYDAEWELGDQLLRNHSRPTIVLIPLPGSSYLYVHANRKWDVEAEFNFKLCLPFHASNHDSHLAGVVRDRRIECVVVTDAQLHGRLAASPAWKALRDRLVLSVRSLPYGPGDVVFEVAVATSE